MFTHELDLHSPITAPRPGVLQEVATRLGCLLADVSRFVQAFRLLKDGHVLALALQEPVDAAALSWVRLGTLRKLSSEDHKERAHY